MSGITDVGADAARESAERNQSNGDYESDYERYDVSGDAFAKAHPTTAVRGTARVLRYFPDWDNDEPDRGYFGVVIDDPSLVTEGEDLEGSVIFQSTEDTGDDYKIVNVDDSETKVLDGSGVDFAGNLFYGEETDEFDDDRIILKATGSSGRSIASTLDVKGAGGAHSVGAYDDEEIELHDGGFPEHSGHLVEYHPDGRNGERPRIARDTELRPDVEGEDIVIMVQRLREIQEDYDGPAYWATVLVQTDDEEGDVEIEGDQFNSLEPTDEFEPDEEMLRETGYISWNRVDLDVLNEAREAAGFDPYTPQGSSEESEAEA